MDWLLDLYVILIPKDQQVRQIHLFERYILVSMWLLTSNQYIGLTSNYWTYCVFHMSGGLISQRKSTWTGDNWVVLPWWCMGSYPLSEFLHYQVPETMCDDVHNVENDRSLLPTTTHFEHKTLFNKLLETKTLIRQTQKLLW